MRVPTAYICSRIAEFPLRRLGPALRDRARGSCSRSTLQSLSPMPIAFKEWAVTVRALAEGEQLLTLRKGGIREPDKHFALEHDRFFLYPTFDHQRTDLVRESHEPELRRALEEGVWPRRRAAAHATDRATAGSPSPTACGSAPGPRSPRHYTITDRRCCRRAVAVLRVDDATTPRSGWPGSAAIRCTSSCCAPTGSRGPVTVKVRDEYGGCRSWLELHARAALRGHAGALRRRVRARLGGDRGDRLRRRTRRRLS